MLIMLQGRIQVVKDWPEIGSKCTLHTDKSTLGLRDRRAVDMLHEAMQQRAIDIGQKSLWGKLFD